MYRVVSLLTLPVLLMAAGPVAAQSMGELGAAMSTNNALTSTSAPSAANTLNTVKGKVADINQKQAAKVAAWEAAGDEHGTRSRSDGGWEAGGSDGKGSAWESASDSKDGGWATGAGFKKRKPAPPKHH